MVPLEYENDELLKQKKINRTIDFKVKGLRTGAAEAAYYSLEFFFFLGGGVGLTIYQIWRACTSCPQKYFFFLPIPPNYLEQNVPVALTC